MYTAFCSHLQYLKEMPCSVSSLPYKTNVVQRLRRKANRFVVTGLRNCFRIGRGMLAANATTWDLLDRVKQHMDALNAHTAPDILAMKVAVGPNGWPLPHQYMFISTFLRNMNASEAKVMKKPGTKETNQGGKKDMKGAAKAIKRPAAMKDTKTATKKPAAKGAKGAKNVTKKPAAKDTKVAKKVIFKTPEKKDTKGVKQATKDTAEKSTKKK